MFNIDLNRKFVAVDELFGLAQSNSYNNLLPVEDRPRDLFGRVYGDCKFLVVEQDDDFSLPDFPIPDDKMKLISLRIFLAEGTFNNYNIIGDKKDFPLFFTVVNETSNYGKTRYGSYNITKNPSDYSGEKETIDVEQIDLFSIGCKFSSRSYPFYESDVILSVKVNDEIVTIIIDPQSCDRLYGLKLNEAFNFEVSGKEFPANNLAKLLVSNKKYSSSSFDFTFDTVNDIRYRFNFDSESFKNLLKYFVSKGYYIDNVLGDNKTGITKVLNKIEPFLEELKEKNIFGLMGFRTFLKSSKFTVNSVKVSTVFNSYFGKIKTFEEFEKACNNLSDLMMKIKQPINYSNVKSMPWIEELPEFKEKRKAVLKTQGNRAFTKIMQDIDSIDISESRFPLLYQAMTEGEIPLRIFFKSEKNEQYFLFNDNFVLWEEMLEKHPEITKKLAKEASKRTTYEKDLMSYFYFILYALPEYLNEQTGYPWTCLPKLVNSENELDAPKEDETGVVRQRSALTPIVDNENKIVTVPYASLAIGGYQTVYCYSLSYNVIKRGFVLNGNTAMFDIEEKLNGRDDYGLMFYTLTGTAQGRGYPTFLIIFERLKEKGTRVHFHRTHPCRSKDGDYNPVHNWVPRAYNWIAGNINAKHIAAQQGDLIFVKTDKEIIPEKTVNSYDSHLFREQLPFQEVSGKDKYVLGRIIVENGTYIDHPEHETTFLPMGNYEIRTCRSWEANPKAIWTLNID